MTNYKIGEGGQPVDPREETLIPFKRIEEGAEVEFKWETPQSDEEQWATGKVVDADEFDDEYGIPDGEPYLIVDALDQDRDFRLSLVYDGQVESISYDTYESGNARRVGNLTSFQVVR